MLPRILVVENDESTCRLYEAVFRAKRWRVDTARNGAHALLLAEHLEFDAFVLDLHMPHGDGTAVLDRLRALRPELLASVVVVSAASGKELAELQECHPDIRVMRKPFDVDDLVAAVVELRASRSGPDSWFATFVQQSVASGARAGLIVSLVDGRVNPVRTFGYDDDQVAKWFPDSVARPYPICTAMREAHPVWLGSLRAAVDEYPGIAGTWSSMSTHSIAAVPLMDDDGVVTGAVGWSFITANGFSGAHREALTRIAETVAPQLDAYRRPHA